MKADTPTRKIGILGVGSIGQSLARAVEQKDIDAELVALSDQDREKAEAFVTSLSSHPFWDSPNLLLVLGSEPYVSAFAEASRFGLGSQRGLRMSQRRK